MKRKGVIIIVVALIVLIVGAVGAFYFYRVQQEQEHDELIQSIAQGADDVIAEVTSALSANAPTTWVYDRDNNLMFTLRLTDARQSITTLPEVLATAISGQSEGDPARLVTREFLASKNVGLGGDTEEGYLRRVTQDVATEDLLRYLAITSSYGGGYTGATDAANNYFGKTLDRLNDAQLAFLAATYRNSNLDIDTYLAEHSLNRERLGLIDKGFTNAAIRSCVLEELQEIEGLKLKERSYNVKLTISTSQQAALQAELDNSMRQLIDLNADGSYAINGSFAVVDGNTGFVRALVPGRTSNKVASTVFKVNGLGYIDNTLVLLSTLKKDTITGDSLVAVQKNNGDVEYHSVAELYESQGLAAKPTNKNIGALDMVDLLFSQEEAYTGVSMISEIKEVQGSAVYTAKGSTGLQMLDSKVCEFFDNGQGLVMFGEEYPLSTGLVSFQKTADYIVAFVGGTDAVGGTATSEERNILSQASASVISRVASLYPTPSANIWLPSSKELKALVCEENFKLVGTPIFDGIASLLDMPITSRQERQDWESVYTSFQKAIADNTKYFGEVRATQLNERLDSARNARSQELLQYSV